MRIWPDNTPPNAPAINQRRLEFRDARENLSAFLIIGMFVFIVMTTVFFVSFSSATSGIYILLIFIQLAINFIVWITVRLNSLRDIEVTKVVVAIAGLCFLIAFMASMRNLIDTHFENAKVEHIGDYIIETHDDNNVAEDPIGAHLCFSVIFLYIAFSNFALTYFIVIFLKRRESYEAANQQNEMNAIPNFALN